MQGTRGRDSVESVNSRDLVGAAGWAGSAKLGILALLLVLFMVACGGDGEGVQPTLPGGQATVLVSTVTPSREAATETPTPVPPTVTPTPTPPAPLAALVNGQYIFLSAYERQVAQYEQALLELGLDPDTQDGQERLAQARQDVLESMIDDALIAQGAEAMGLGVSDEELGAQVEGDIETGGGQAAFEEWLQSTGLTREDYAAMLRQSLQAQRVWDVVTADVPDAVEQVHARHIVVDSQETADQLLLQLREGADFVALAREYSLDVATRDNGGDLGWFPRGVVAIELEEAAFALQPGEVSEAIWLAENFHIVQVVERASDHPLTPEMHLALMQDKFDQWLEEQRMVAIVERFVGE